MARLKVHVMPEDKCIPIAECEFSARVEHLLQRAKIKKVGDILPNLDRLVRMHGFGKMCYFEISDYFVAREIDRFGLEDCARRMID